MLRFSFTQRKTDRSFRALAFYIVLLLQISFLALAFAPQSAHAKPNRKYASIVLDSQTGRVLSQSNADKILHPASLTKMMTMLMVFDALEQRQISLNDRIRISHHAASMQPSKIGLPVGASIRVHDALKILAVKSANDIAAATAEFLAGSEYKFAKRMTVRAHQLGMKRTRFVNASGLHDPRQVSTARDMARLSRIIIHRYPQYYHYFNLKSVTYRGKTYKTHNRLMKTYKGMDGLKTGYIRASGFNLASSAVRNNRRLVAVVFGGRTGKSRNAHMAVLLDRGFKKVAKMRLPKAILSFIPKPSKKPDHLMRSGYKPMVLAQASKPEQAGKIATIEPSAGVASIPQSQKRIIGALASSIQTRKSSILTNMLGQGDLDEASATRFQTGLMAIAAHTGKRYYIDGLGSFGSNRVKSFKTSLNLPSKVKPEDAIWSVQVGAYKSRAQTDRAIANAKQQIPSGLGYGHALIIPTQVNGKILFRGRLAGYNKEHASKICGIIKDCMVIAPQ